EPVYEPIGFDASQTRWYAQELVDLGHPEWEGRMSGSAEEAAGAQMILDNLTEMGYSPQLNTYPVPMFAINSAPIIAMCQPPAGGIFGGPVTGASCNSGVGAQVTTFEHRTDFVLQGYSGSADIQFGQEMELIDLDDGTEDSLWSDASGKVGIVRGGNSIDGNTGIYIKAAEFGLAAILRINNQSNCGQIESDDCVPIFKSIRVDDMKAANSGSIPENIPFIAVSNNTGNQMLELASQGAFLRLFSDVDNAGDIAVSVPCGTLYGKSEDLIIVGAHHDTVYHAQGAVDDTSGTATVLEMARQLAIVANESGTPEYTIRFCTWGGEEEGLWGSKAYVGANANDLARNLRLYINLDMNHVDIDIANRGNSLRFFSNSAQDINAMEDVLEVLEKERPDLFPKYTVSTGLLAGERGEPDGMPYNSDHAPFVYDLPDGVTGNALLCYGSGSYEYHTYADTMDRFNEESLGVSVIAYGTYIRHLAWPVFG
ncbi:MAG: M20/M25/M40 family metallo-hydrolase, partial [Candidatus Poseidoniaceae archaeon]|nr:M20/M25/M40 family metallo-hydrolase [Candidatus Poseidoniaceae archaeon]